MSEFRKYMHVERLGSDEVDGLLEGTCYVFPKIDGTNASVWLGDDGKVKAGSRNRELSLDEDNAGFCRWVTDNADEFEGFFEDRPSLTIYGEWLCLSGDTEIRLLSGGKRGHTQTMKEMFEYFNNDTIEESSYVRKDGTRAKTRRPSWWKRYGLPQCFSLFIEEDEIRPQRIANIVRSGSKEVYEVETRKGYSIKATEEHKFYTNAGWVPLKDISIGDVVATTELYNVPEKRRYGRGSRKIAAAFREIREEGKCQICGTDNSLEVHHKDGDWRNNSRNNLVVLCRECHSKQHHNVTASNQSYQYDFDKVTSISYIGYEECYDIAMDGGENSASFIANGFVVHNCPHTLRTYREDAWRNFYIFDVYDHTQSRYLSYPHYSELCTRLSFPVIAPLEIVENATEKHLIELLDRNTYLIADGNGPGEGVVIKRYDYVNAWGRTVWGKIVRNEFKERNLEAFGAPTVAMKSPLEQRIAVEYVTRGRITKTIEKMRDSGPLTSRRIPELLGRVWNEIVADEMWDIVKDHKNPTIDFKALNRAVIAQTKANCPELFGG